MKIEINIEDYLTEEDKKQICKESFKNMVYKGLIEKTKEKDRMANYERIVSNSIHFYLNKEIDEIIGADVKALIKNATIDTIKKKDFTYSLFRKKSAWEKEDSLALTISNEAVESYRDVMTEKIHRKLDEAVEELGVDNLQELFSNVFHEFITERLK